MSTIDFMKIGIIVLISWYIFCWGMVELVVIEEVLQGHGNSRVTVFLKYWKLIAIVTASFPIGLLWVMVSIVIWLINH